MSSNMEAEMARFEEEISHDPGFSEQNENFNPPPPPPMMPPPMFLPHALQQNSNKQQNFDNGKENSDSKKDEHVDFGFSKNFGSNQNQIDVQHPPGTECAIKQPNNDDVHATDDQIRSMKESESDSKPPSLGMNSHDMVSSVGSGSMGPRPMGPGPMGPGPMGPGPMGPGPMGPGPMGSGSMGPGPMGSGPMGPRPMGPGPMGPRPMGPHPMGPGPMGPGPMGPGPMGPGPMGPGPMGPGPMGPGPMGPGPMGPGPMGPGPMGPGPRPMGGPPTSNAGPGNMTQNSSQVNSGMNVSNSGLPRFDGPNFMGPNNDNNMIGPMPPPMPGFFPPPVLPDFGSIMRKQQTVYSSAPVLKKRVVESKKSKTVESETKQFSESKEKVPDPFQKKIREENEKKVEKKDEFSSGADLPATSSKLEVGPQAGPQVLPQTAPQVTMVPQAPFPSQPMLYGLSPLAGNPQLAKAAAQTQQKRKKMIRTAAGQKWEDQTLLEWDPSDYRIFCGDLGNEVTDDTLARVFSRYSSFQRARVIREKNSKKSKGYGFVSFKDPNDFIRAMREINGKYVGNRPIKLRKSNWKDRNIEVVRKKVKEKKKLGYKV